MYLKKLHIKNFRCFSNYEIEFASHVTVLFGKNGSGKTSLIHALHKALSFMMISEKIKEKDPRTKKMKPVGERTLRGGNPYVGVEGYSIVGDVYFHDAKPADYLMEIAAEGYLDTQTPLDWKMSAYAINCRLRPSEYKQGFEQLYAWHIRTGKRPLLAYYSDGYPHYSNFSQKKKEQSKESFLVGSSFESVGYTEWNSEVGCTNIWLKRLETKMRTIENMRRRITLQMPEEIRQKAEAELGVAEAEICYIIKILKDFSKKDLEVVIETLEISPYDAHLHIVTTEKDYSFRNLPAGYKRLFYIALDLAYRSWFLGGGKGMEVSGIAIIDEIDLHLHPGLEQVVLERFMETFPNIQFIVSTHSPLVLAGLETQGKENAVLRMSVDSGSPEILQNIHGIDYNLMLEENMDVVKRKPAVQALFDQAWQSISDKDINGAKTAVENLKNATPEDQPELVRLRLFIKRLEVIGQ